MGFLSRSLLGLFILGLTLGLLGFAAGNIAVTISEVNSREERRRPPRERIFAVNVAPVELGAVTPRIIAYGEVASWRALEVRASSGGRIIVLSDAFRDGGQIAQGEVVFRIDPTEARADLALADTQIKEAEAELIEARAALALAEGDLAATIEQKDLRAAALARQSGLAGRGVGSEAAVETASLALSSAVQTVLAREQSLAQARARILRAEIGLERQGIAQAEAQRKLEETVYVAPFDAIVAEVNAVEGRLVSANEQLGRLTDRSALEVGFRVSNAEFSRIVDATGAVRPVKARATLDLAGTPLEVAATVDRAAAEVGDGQSGRLIYARLDPAASGFLYAGDFLQVELTENPLQNVMIAPSSAVTSSGAMLLLGEEDRLEAHQAKVLRRQGDEVILGDVPAGRFYVTRRQPQLGAGIKVRPVKPNAEMEEPEMIALDDARRAKLIAAVEGNAYIPADAKARILENLNKPEVPAATVARLEARMGGGAEAAPERGTGSSTGSGARSSAGEGDAELVKLDAEQQARLIAFVESNERMPGPAKERILTALRSGSAPKSMIERIEARIGG